MALKSKKGTPNLTGRVRIKRSAFNIEVDWTGDVPSIDRDSFKLEVPSSSLDDSKVFIDASFRTVFQRFDLGTIDDLALPADLELDRIGHNPITFLIRVVHPVESGLLTYRSASYIITPKGEKGTKKKGESTVQLLEMVCRSMDAGVPTNIEFPEIAGSSESVKIVVNRDGCELLWYALKESEPAYMALTMPPYLTAIAERLVADTLREDFDPEDSDPVTSDSPWQNLWNSLLKSWTGRGLQDIDLGNAVEVSEWIKEVLEQWSLRSGNPAKQVNRMLGGL